MSDDLVCQELVELVTEYLDGALAEDELARFEQHVHTCGGCRNYVDQFRRTIELTTRVDADAPAPELRAVLLEQFRAWKTSQPTGS